MPVARCLSWLIAGILASVAGFGFSCPARAAESNDHGLSGIVAAGMLRSQTPLVDMALVQTAAGLMYVVDLYGDGLIRFRVREAVATALLQGQPVAKVVMDLRTISDMVGETGLGAVASAASFRQEKDALVLEANTAANSTQQDTNHIGLTDLGYFKHEWQPMPRIPVKKSHARQMLAVQSLTVHPAAPSP